jgi:putative nucleotidyltransferase with HDIG domain
MSAATFSKLSRSMQTYVMVVVIAGFAIIIQSLLDIASNPKDWSWTVLALLTLVSGSATVRLPSLPATISVSETFVFTSVLLFGPAAGTLTVALDTSVITFWSHKKGHPLYKIVFNLCALPLTIWLAGHLFFLISGIQPLASTSQNVALRQLLVPLVIFTIAYYGLNSWIIAFAIALESGVSAFRIWRDNFVWISLNYFGGASVAALLVSYTRDLDFSYLAVIVPLLVVLYFTFSMSMGRVEDANRHLSQLNTLYMSTIETLAMAIDAKDQITHGHIRRVQAYAVALAKEVGVTDPNLIKAIEAAALLHDMGKLAVPEYILNKPGPLTPTEFEKMKLHASVGADILSAIDFPYPVVPIVRHHHESWDGSGYPSGLAGADIPIGARILSVVDCFDALTSDRPYRPRLSDKDALRVLKERRGAMYDPLIVDTFMRVYTTIATPDTDPGHKSLSVIADAAVASPTRTRSQRLEDITASSDEAVTLFALAQALTSRRDPKDIGGIVFEHLRRLVPHSCAILFIYRSESDDLSAVFVAGELAPMVLGMRISLGQRLSGWVAANRQTIRNSDAVLDLGEIAKTASPRLRSCLATHVTIGQNLVGVISLYASAPKAFTEDHERILEAVATRVAPAVQSPDPASGIQSERQVSVGPSPTNSTDSACVAILRFDAEMSRSLEDIADVIRTKLGASDQVFRRNGDLILLFQAAGRDAATQLVAGVALHLQTTGITTSVKYALACAPEDGATIQDLLSRGDAIHAASGKRPPSTNSSIH